MLLNNNKAEELFRHLDTVVLDEWHELMGSKRGTQTELCLSWLRQLRPSMQTWAISATIGNLDQAARHALGTDGDPVIIGGAPARVTEIRSLLPETIDGFPWAGHLGLRMYEDLVAAMNPGISTLLFTNTRNQSERWFQCLRFACPEMDGALALHHSAIDRSEREAIEASVKAGTIRWVVCTSSLDLGVDFQPVEQVVQIGSPKNLARLLQRAGRSAHLPGGTSPGAVHAHECPGAARTECCSTWTRGRACGTAPTTDRPARCAAAAPHEPRLRSGFHPEETLRAVRSTAAFSNLAQDDWDWCLLSGTRRRLPGGLSPLPETGMG